MRRSGAIEYITPLQIETESSRTPKSVIKTTVGVLPDALADRTRQPPARTATESNAITQNVANRNPRGLLLTKPPEAERPATDLHGFSQIKLLEDEPFWDYRLRRLSRMILLDFKSA